MDTVSQLYPEYYILKVNGFNQVAKSPLEEWIYYLNTGEIPSTATAPGLEEARERLKLDSMTKDELAAYYRHLDNIVILRDNINTEREEGRAEGKAEGRAEGKAEGRAEGRAEGIEEGLNKGLAKGHKEGVKESARNLKKLGVAIEVISQATGLSKEEIEIL